MGSPVSGRGRATPFALAAVVVGVAIVWDWAAGTGTARLIRRGFEALSAELVLEILLALLIVGVGVRLAPMRQKQRLAERLGGAATRVVPHVRRVPTEVWLSVIVAGAALFRVVLDRANHTPKVLGDELIYTGLAKGLAAHGEPLLRGSVDVGQSTIYSLFLAPAFRLSGDGAEALAAIRVIDPVAMALTAIPTFLLARRVVPRGWALGVAAVAVMVPWTVYSALTMTESLFYPVFVAYAVVLARALERPSTARQLAMLGTLAVLVGVRAQGLTVAIGTLITILVSGAVAGGVAAEVRRFSVTLAVFAAALVVDVVARVAGIAVPTSSYNVLTHSFGQIVAMLKWGAWSLGSFQLALGVVALAALPAALRGMLRRRRPVAVRATGAVTVGLGVGLLVSVALLAASPYGLGWLHERNLFYITPLILVCTAHWLHNGLERPAWFAAAGALASLTLAAALPTRLVVGWTNNVDVPSDSFFIGLQRQMPDVSVRFWVVLFAAVGVGTFLVAKRPLFPILAVVVALAAVTARVDYRDNLTSSQVTALSWVDHSLPHGAEASLVYLGLPSHASAVVEAERESLAISTEYFNTHIGAVAHVAEANPADGLSSPQLVVGSRGLIRSNDGPFEPDYVVLDSRQPIIGHRLARLDFDDPAGHPDRRASLTLWKVTLPLRFAGVTDPSKYRVPSRVGYCLQGQFLDLQQGEPQRDRRFNGATVASFIQGQGITCSPPPPGFIRRGYATANMGVPAGIYPYYTRK